MSLPKKETSAWSLGDLGEVPRRGSSIRPFDRKLGGSIIEWHVANDKAAHLFPVAIHIGNGVTALGKGPTGTIS
jgi:hypothetical protein